MIVNISIVQNSTDYSSVQYIQCYTEQGDWPGGGRARRSGRPEYSTVITGSCLGPPRSPCPRLVSPPAQYCTSRAFLLELDGVQDGTRWSIGWSIGGLHIY